MPEYIAVSKLKASLSAQLARVKAGEELVVTERGQPVARLLPCEGELADERLAGLARAGLVRLPRRPPGSRLRKRSPVRDREGSVRKALLAEREEGR